MGTLRASSFYKNPKGKGRHGEKLSGTPVQLTLAAALQNGPLPSHYLRALWPSDTSAKDAITFLRQEGIIEVPKEANRTFGRPRVWQLSKDGIKFLQDHGAYSGTVKHGNGQYKHSHMVAVISYLFNLLPPNVSKLDIDHSSIVDFHIYPDAPPFGFRLNKRFFIHGFEADRGTEPLTGHASETIESKIRNYTTYLKARGYKKYGVMNCAIPFITMSEDRAQNILDLIDEIADTEKDHFIVRALPDFIHWEKYPDPTDFLISTDWQQTGSRSLNILNILKGTTNGQTRESETSTGTIGHHQERGAGA